MRGHLDHLPFYDRATADGRAAAAVLRSGRLGPVRFVSFYGPCGGSHAQHSAALAQAVELATEDGVT